MVEKKISQPAITAWFCRLVIRFFRIAKSHKINGNTHAIFKIAGKVRMNIINLSSHIT